MTTERISWRGEQPSVRSSPNFFQARGLVGGFLGTGAHGQRLGQRRTDALGQLAGRDAGTGGDVDAVVATRFARDVLSLGEREHRDARAAERLAAGELDDPHERVVPRGRTAGDHDLLAEQ
jgi:hypothetical protein